MSQVKLTKYTINGLSINIPKIWKVETETYTEPDGRECSMIDISAEDGDPRSIVISYGPMPDGSNALMEAGGTYEETIGEIEPGPEDDPICEYDFLGTTAFGFELATEDGLSCNFICAEVGTREHMDAETECKLLTVLTTAKTYEDIDDLLDLIEENISFH